MKKIYILFIICVVCNNFGFSQSSLDINYQMPKVNLPQVASVMKYIDYPTDLHRGLVNIDIPLYMLREGDLTLPVSISYHASGLRVREGSGIVGQGWTLNAEPSVSRSINGKPDETGYLQTYANTNIPYGMEENILNGAFDVTPDAFYYKLLDRSGKFYFNRDVYTRNSPVEIVVHPYEPIKITSSSPSQGFNITDDKGISYEFIHGYGQVYGETGYNTTQWPASKISSASGKYNISFGYKEPAEKYRGMNFNPCYIAVEEETEHSLGSSYPEFSCGIISMPILTEYTPINDSRVGTYNIIRNPDYEAPYMVRDGFRYYYGIKDYNLRSGRSCGLSYTANSANPKIRYRHLETITTGSVIIKFFYGLVPVNDDDEEPLERIEVWDNIDNKIVRKMYFIQSVYNAGTSRKKLDELRITDKDDVIIEKYTFEYDKNNLVPRRTSIDCDHWGFSGTERSLYDGLGIPVQEIETAKHVSAWDIEKYTMYIGDIGKSQGIADAGILKSIIYPTGRKSTFYFEPNQYLHNYYTQAQAEGRERRLDEPEYEIKNAGGLRIAKIEEYDPSSNKRLTKQYKYGETGNGVGQIRHQPSLADYSYGYNTLIIPNVGHARKTKVRMFVPESLREMTYNGSSTKYDYVTEYSLEDPGNGQALSNGKTTYKFQLDNPGFGYISGTTVNYDADSEWAKGYLLERTDYKYNESGEPDTVRRVKNQYTFLNPKDIPMRKIYKNTQLRNYTMHNESDIWSSYQIYPYDQMTYTIVSGCIRKDTETTDIYSTTGGMMTSETKNYFYENPGHVYPTRIEIGDGNKTIRTEEFLYPQDLTNPSTAVNTLIGRNQLNTLMIKQTSFGGRVWVNNNDYGIKAGNPVPVSIWTGQRNGEEERIQILQYDTYGNPLHIQSDGGINTVYIWGYNGQHMICEIKNATYEEVKTALGGTDPASYSSLNSFPAAINTLSNHTMLKHASISVNKYHPLFGITEATDPSGHTTYYVYDTAGRLKETYFIENGEKKIIQAYQYHYMNNN